MITSKWTGDGLEKMQKAVAALGSKDKARAAYRMALNDTNDSVFTQVKRVLAKQVGVGTGLLVRYGGLKKVKAINARLSAEIKSDGDYLPLSAFKSNPTRKGVSATPWGKRHVFGGTFQVAKFGGNAFKRVEKWNKKAGRFNAIEKLYGPSVPNEMVKDASEEAFQQSSAKFLPAEVARQLKRLSGGIIG